LTDMACPYDIVVTRPQIHNPSSFFICLSILL
jgi:hypothetical protein